MYVLLFALSSLRQVHRTRSISAVSETKDARWRLNIVGHSHARRMEWNEWCEIYCIFTVLHGNCISRYPHKMKTRTYLIIARSIPATSFGPICGAGGRGPVVRTRKHTETREKNDSATNDIRYSLTFFACVFACANRCFCASAITRL